MSKKLIPLFWCLSILSFNANASICEEYQIGSSVNLKVPATGDQSEQEKTFIVKSCSDQGEYQAEAALENQNTSSKLIAVFNDSNINDQSSITFIRENNNEEFHPILTVKSDSTLDPHNCPTGQHWDDSMQMCMPDVTPTPTPNSHNCPSGQHWDESMQMCMPDQTPTPSPTPNSHNCPAGQHWDDSMQMCMPDQTSNKLLTTIQVNQFGVYSNTSGNRGASRITGPGMWMLTMSKPLGTKNNLSLNMMGGIEKYTVGENGTPQLFQNDHVDAMHAHDPVMQLNFEDVLSLGQSGERKLIFDISPRGMATVGPAPFMMRSSAVGNPDAPLGHGMQDSFHDTWSVAAVKYKTARTLIEASVFSGQDQATFINLPKPDSYAFRINQNLNDHVTIGASIAEVSNQNQYLSSWVTTNSIINGNVLNTSTIWAQIKERGATPSLNSFMEEFVYQMGKNKFFGRVEVLQRTPDELLITVTDQATQAKWVKAVTLGYERTVYSKNGYNLYAGGSYTIDSAPKSFQTAYGTGELGGAKVFVRMNLIKHH